MTNAIKYNKPGGNIEISIKESGKSISVTFKETGIGLNDSDIDRIFDRFYRADIARTRSVEGTGLGLSIAAAIVKQNGGKISVDSDVEGIVFRASSMFDLKNAVINE